MSRELIERKCIVEGTVKPVAELLRFVELNNALLPDFNKKASGERNVCYRQSALSDESIGEKAL